MSQQRYVTRLNNAINQNGNSHEPIVTHKANANNRTTQTKNSDKRLPPSERKHVKLWQYYLIWSELVEMRKRHTLRMKSAIAGKSNIYADTEQWFIDVFRLDQHIDNKSKRFKNKDGKLETNDGIFRAMIEEGEKVGLIWQWIVSHKGIAESLAAQILALIDDIEKFDSIAKLWRYAGYGIYEYWVDENGSVQCPKQGWKWQEIKVEGEKKLQKYRVWTVVDQSKGVTQLSYVSNNGSSHDRNVTHQGYAIPQNIELPLIERVDYLQPEPNWTLKKLSDRNVKGYHSPFNCKLKAALWNMTESFVYQQTPGYVDLYYSEKKRLRELHPETKKVNGKTKWNDGHINDMAKRKMRKEFLKRLWLKWREFEGLPLSEEY